MIGRTAVMVVLAALGLAGSAAAVVACVASTLAATPIPTPIGVGPRFHPSAVQPEVRAGKPIGNLRCAGIARMQRAHVELFAQRRVVIVPAGIGVSHARACTYPVRTVDPTGVIEFDAAKRVMVGTLFRIWGRRLVPEGLLSFTGRVRAYVGGTRWHASVRSIPLRRHAEIVLEVGPYVPPHPKFLFGPGR